MKRSRSFIHSFSGLSPMWSGLGALAVLAILLGARGSEADTPCPVTWLHCFDCSSNPEHPICTRAEADPAAPEAKYVYCSKALDASCNFWMGDCWYASTPCSEAVPASAINRRTQCDYYNECAAVDSTKPYRYCVPHPDDDIEKICACSSTPCWRPEPTPTSVLTPAAGRPAHHGLGNAYPNPFNPLIVIPLDLVLDQKQVHLALYDVLGRRVRQVWDGPLGAGSHRFVWDGRDEAGKAVAAGVYIYRVEMDGRVEAKKTTKLP